jgi:YVTN family beta-propeller protein
VISTKSSTVIATIAVGVYPYAVSFTPDGTLAYVVNDVSNTISVISTAKNTVVATVPVGSNPVVEAIVPVGCLPSFVCTEP